MGVYAARQTIIRYSLGAALAAACACAWIAAPLGATSQSITLSHTADRPAIDPGGSYSGDFQIINSGTSHYDVSLSVAPYFVSGLDYTADFRPLPGRTAVTDWFHLSTTNASLAPNDATTVRYRINVPRNTQPGGYYAVIFAQASAPQNTPGVAFSQRLGQLVYITVNGPVKQAGSIQDWQVPFWQQAPLTATVELVNSGGVHYFSNVDIKVMDIFGAIKYEDRAQKAVLPQTSRRITAEWTGAPALGLYKIAGSATVLGHAQPLPERWVIVMSEPLRVVLIVVAVLALSGAIAARIVVWRNKR